MSKQRFTRQMVSDSSDESTGYYLCTVLSDDGITGTATGEGLGRHVPVHKRISGPHYARQFSFAWFLDKREVTHDSTCNAS